MNRLLVILGLTMLAGACSSTQTSRSVLPETATSVTYTPSAGSAFDRLQAADILALIDGTLSNDAWVFSVVSMSEVDLLRRPVVRIALSDQNAVVEAMNALQSALMSVDVWGVLEISGPDSTSFGTIGLASFEPIELPPPVASGEEFSKWLDQAFGSGSPAPEDWVAHVTSTGFAESLPTGYTSVLTVQTDLPWDADGRRIANEIAQAIAAGSLSFAVSFTIYYADTGYEFSGAIEPPFTFGFDIDDFMKAAEEFIEGSEVATQVGETFTDAVCAAPAAIIPGEEFTCTAVDGKGRIWDFTVVVESSYMFLVVGALPQGGYGPIDFARAAEKYIEGSDVASQAATTFTSASCAPPAQATPGEGFTCTAVDANGATWDFSVVVQSAKDAALGLGFLIVSGAPRV
ncbi:MAG: hypothetical protein HY826_04030 [Actinobacteria bacterium]|nr:hypothetical protein [Actinomycetota bacterium]